MVLALHSCDASDTLHDVDFNKDLPNGIVWIDLLRPSAEETAFIARATGLQVPGLAELSEIESSSRLRTENGALYLSTSMLYRADTGQPLSTPVGFILNANHLITVRFENLGVFEKFSEQRKRPGVCHPSSAGTFVGLLEANVDRLADVLEKIVADLDALSHAVFGNHASPEEEKARKRKAGKSMRDTVRQLGREGDLVSKARDNLLGLGRIAPFANSLAVEWMPAEVRTRLKTLRQDIASLNDYDGYVTAKIQFLLDATLGLINIDQNDVIKVLTVVTIIGIGPTFVASWYGMNYKNIPEYDWAWGYPYAIFLAIVTGIVPLLWLKARRWI